MSPRKRKSYFKVLRKQGNRDKKKKDLIPLSAKKKERKVQPKFQREKK